MSDSNYGDEVPPSVTELGLGQSPISPIGDPLAWARVRGVDQTGLPPGIHTQGAQPAQIMHPQGAAVPQNAPPAHYGGGFPNVTSNGLSPAVIQHDYGVNGLFGNVDALVRQNALGAMQPVAVQGSPVAGGGHTAYGSDIEGKITSAASKYGIDPKVALAVYRSEGASGYTGDGGSSFGPFQLHMGGLSKKSPHSGLGDSFKAETGLDPRDPKTVDSQIDYAMRHASQNGWGAWSGSRDSAGRFLGLPTEGISPFYGIRGGSKDGGASAGVRTELPGVPTGPFSGANAPSGPMSGMDPNKLWKLMLIRSLFPQFQFHDISYDPYAVHSFATHGGY